MSTPARATALNLLIEKKRILVKKFNDTFTAIDALDSMMLKYGETDSAKELMATWVAEHQQIMAWLNETTKQLMTFKK